MQCTQTCTSVVSSTKSHGPWSHIGEITCTLGKSLCSWGCWVDSCRRQGTACCRGHAILWYTISVQLCTHHQWSWLRCQAHPGESVMFHSLQCSPIVLLSVGDWQLRVTECEVIFLLRPITVWVIMGKNQTPQAAAVEARERPTSTAMIAHFFQKCSAMTWHVSCVAFWTHKILSCTQSSSTPAQYWHFLRLINYESTDPLYSIWHLLFPLCHQLPSSINWELSVLLQRIFHECAYG